MAKDQDKRDFSLQIDEAILAAAVASVEKHIEHHEEGAARDEKVAAVAAPDEITLDLTGMEDSPSVSESEPVNSPTEEQLAAALSRIADLERQLAAAGADARTARDRALTITLRMQRTQEALDRKKMELEDAEGKLAEWEKLLTDLRASARSAEEDRVRARQRHAREIEEARRFGNEGLMRELLPVLDNFELALAPGVDESSLREGVGMITSQLQGALARMGLDRIEGAPGDVFDPNLHEAVEYVESAEVPPGAVLKNHFVGYRLSGRLLRAARVSVARAPATTPAEPVQSAETEPSPE